MKTKGPGHCIAAAVVMLQLVICAQMFISVFPKWDGGLAVGPNMVCVTGQDGRVECIPISRNTVVCVVVAFCSNAPLPLTLFAGLSFLFGARLPDVDALRLSAAGQALAATLALVGAASSAVGYGNLVLLPAFAMAIANSVCICVEMGAAAALCWESMRRLNRQRQRQRRKDTAGSAVCEEGRGGSLEGEGLLEDVPLASVSASESIIPQDSQAYP